jgi:hypothetical protein
MASQFNAFSPKFRVIFDKTDPTSLVMTLLDLVTTGYTSYGTLSGFKGLFQVKDPDGTIVYQGAGFSTTAPTWSTPDTNGSTPTWSKTGISPATFKLGVWTFTYVCTMDGTNFVVFTKTYNFQYVSPTVVIEHEIHCDTSELYSSNLTECDIIIDGDTFTPSTYTLSHKVTPPSDSGFTPVPGTTADEVRVIGGGSTDATRLWTNTWQTDISIDLGYSLENFPNTTSAWIEVLDTITGHKGVEVVCEDCDCSLLQCYLNLIAKYDDAEKGHRRGAFELREKAIKATSYMVAYSKALECGKDTTDICNDLNAILADEDCSCGQVASDSSVPVIQRRNGSGGGGGTVINPFKFTFVTNPTGGTDGDTNWNPDTNEIWQNVGGTWVHKYTITTIKGDPGNDGADGTGASVLWNDVSNNATGNSTSKTLLKSYTLGGGVMGNDEDLLKVKALYQLALNDNGKSAYLDFGTDQMIEYFTDSLIVDPYLVLESDISRKGASVQFIESRSIMSDEITLTSIDATQNLSSPIVISAYGKNDELSAGDIICKQLEILYFSLVGGVSTLISNMKHGNEALVANVEKTITFLNPFPPGTTYTLNAVAYDIYGNSQQVNVTPGSEDETGFKCTCSWDATLNWTAIAIP